MINTNRMFKLSFPWVITLLLSWPFSAQADITLQQHLDGVTKFFQDLVDKATNQTAPGDPAQKEQQNPPPSPQPLWPLLSNTVLADQTTVQNQGLAEDIFQMYGINNLPNAIQNASLTNSYYLNHFSNAYCAANTPETAIFQCDGKASPFMQHADLKPDTLLGPDTYPDQPTSTAAMSFIRSLVDPIASHEITALLNDSSDAGKERMVQALQRQSRVNVPLYSLVEAYSKRLPSPGNPKNESFMQILDTEASRRYTDPTWHAAIASKDLSTEALLKEIATMMATSLWIQKEQIKQNERLELLLSVNALLNIRAQDQFDKQMETTQNAAQNARQNAGG